jgi:hypothetical protein
MAVAMMTGKPSKSSTIAIEGVQSGKPASPVTTSTTFRTAHEVAA